MDPLSGMVEQPNRMIRRPSTRWQHSTPFRDIHCFHNLGTLAPSQAGDHSSDMQSSWWLFLSLGCAVQCRADPDERPFTLRKLCISTWKSPLFMRTAWECRPLSRVDLQELVRKVCKVARFPSQLFCSQAN